MSNLLRQMDLKKPQVNRKLIAWVFGICGLVSLVLWWRGGGGVDLGGWWGPLKITYTIQPRTLAATPMPQKTEFERQLQDRLEKEKGEYGVYVYRLDGEGGYGVNENEQMPGMSIFKVPIMVTVLRKVEAGDLKLDGTYELRDEDKASGSGSLTYLDTGSKLTIRQMLKAMGEKSDNTAARILTRMVGKEEIEKTIGKLGMKSTNFRENMLTAYDVAMMWKSLYEGKVINEDLRDQLWSFLEKSIYEDRIPAGLPKKEVKVIHKVGTDGDVWADSGIVMPQATESGDLIMVILNKEVNLERAKIIVPKLAKMIWEHELTR